MRRNAQPSPRGPLLAMLLVMVGMPPASISGQEPPPAETGFVLDLPEWSPDPATLPPELQPLDVDRPTLPDDAADEIVGLETRIDELEAAATSAETRQARDAALDEAITLAERVHALRVEHQGNTTEVVRWRDTKGEPSEWYRITDAAAELTRLRRLRELDDAALAEMATLEELANEARRLYAAGKYAETQAVTERELEIARRVLGEEHPRTLSAMNNLGAMLNAQGRLRDAEPYLLQTLEIRRRVLGPEHPATLISVAWIGAAYLDQGRFAEAEPYYREALTARRHVLGDDHPETLDSIGNMGMLTSSIGQFELAEIYNRCALDGRRRVLGDEDRRTLIAVGSLGALLGETGRLAEAEPYFVQGLALSRRTMGNDHPRTLMAVSNLGVLYVTRGMFAEAERHYREALEGNRRVLGDTHPATLKDFSNMGTLLQAQGRTAEAEPYIRHALAGQRAVYGERHPVTMRSRTNMGVLLQAQGRLEEAEAHYREAHDTLKTLLGEDHQLTVRAAGFLGFALFELDRLDEAEPYYRATLERYRRILGEDHPSTASALNNMGALLEAQGKLTEAEPYYRQSLEIAREANGEDHQVTLCLTHNIARLLQAQGRLDEAEAFWREALAMAERLRVKVAGGAQERAALAGEIRLAPIAAAYARTLVGLDRASEAMTVVERGRSRAGLDLFAGGTAEAERLLRATADPEVLARYEAALAEEQTARQAVFDAEQRLARAAPEERDERREQVQLARALVARRTGAVFAELRDLVPAADPLDAAEIAGALGPGEAVLSYCWSDDGVVALVTRDGGVQSVTLAADGVGANECFDAVNALRSQLATRAASGEVVPEPAVRAARATVFPDALLQMLDGVTALTVVADGPLNGLPLEVLLQDMPIAYAPSATIAIDRHRMAASRQTPRRAVIALGDPTFDSTAAPADAEPAETGQLLAMARDRSTNAETADATALEQVRLYGGGLSPLPATRLEASAVAAQFGDDATLLLGDAATTPQLRTAIESAPPRVLHLATHGLLGSRDRPLLASLALTSPAEPTPDDIGFLTLEEILATWGAQLQGTDLVVLSACDTALGVRRGDTTMTLPLGFFVCGAETVIASLWKVDDRATALLMTRFYANWLGETASSREIDGMQYEPGEPLPKLAALREAKGWLRSLTVADRDRLLGGDAGLIATEVSREPTPRRGRVVAAVDPQSRPYEHPYYWAAFVLYGSAQ